MDETGSSVISQISQINLEPVLSQFTVEDLEDANMTAFHINGLPRFQESRQNKADLKDQYWEAPPDLLNDDSSGDTTVFLQDDMLQGEDMGEWLADA